MHQPQDSIKIIKLVSGEDVVTVLPTGKNQLPDNHQLLRLEKPLLIKYVPQMTLTGFKDYIALIKWCSYTPDKIITIPKNKIMTITNATTEWRLLILQLTNYDQKPAPLRQQNYKTQKLTDEDNERINEVFDEFEEDEEKTIH